jgi:hypothetical protein
MSMAEKWNLAPRITRNLMAVIGLLIGAVLMAAPFVANDVELLSQLFKSDPFALENLKANVIWEWYHGLPGVFLIIGVIGALWLQQTKQIKLANQFILIGGILAVTTAMHLYPNNIEAYSQNSAIQFYKEHVGEACTIQPYRFKSYAHLFYAQKRAPIPNADAAHLPVYWVCKTQHKQAIELEKKLEKLSERNGFVFYREVK